MMKLPNPIREATHTVFDKIFNVWWSWYYGFFRHAPRYIYSGDSWMLEHWIENNYDPICFPLPLKINCVACHGCSFNHSPLLQPNIPKGPYKIFVTEEFCEDYEGLVGKDALVELLWDLEKGNMEIDEKNGLW